MANVLALVGDRSFHHPPIAHQREWNAAALGEQAVAFAIADQERSAEIDAPFPLCLDHHSRQRFAAVAGSLRMWAIENIIQDGALSFQFGAHFCVQILQIGLRVLT